MRSFLTFLGILTLVVSLQGQDIKVFRLSDYDLVGAAKVCEVRTDYGKEIFTFDQDGLLLRSETFFSETDKIVTTYEFSDGELSGKRIEQISSGEIDKSQSFRYNYKTVFEGDVMKTTEEVLSYDAQFRERREFQYDTLGNLNRITHYQQEGIDEVRIEREQVGDTLVTREKENGELQRIEKTFQQLEENAIFKHIYQEEFFRGEPFEAREDVYNSKGKRVSYKVMYYDPEKEAYIEEEAHSFTYGDNGELRAERIRKGAAIYENEFVFVYDDHSPPNWIRKIQTPDNTYVSRIITYFPDEQGEGER